MGPAMSDYNMQLILLSVIQLSGGHCCIISPNLGCPSTRLGLPELGEIIQQITKALAYNSDTFTGQWSLAYSSVHRSQKSLFIGTPRDLETLMQRD